MLAGNNIKCDEIYSEAYDVVQRHYHPQQPDVDSSALPNARNSQSRKAFKLHKTSASYNYDPPLYSEPVEMGNNEGHPSVDLTGMTPTSNLTGVGDLPGEHDGCYDQPRKKSVEGKRKNSSRKEIQFGDYTDPPDFKTENKSGIPSPKPTDYSEPYETQQILKKLERRSTKQRREEIYEFAGPTSNTGHVTKQNNSSAVNERKYSDRTNKEVICEENLKQNQFISSSGTSVDSGVDDPDDYDHLTTWNARKDSFNKSDNGQSSPVNKTPEMTSAKEGGSRSAIYAGAYEEPWDTRKSQQQFNDVLGKAESLSPTLLSPAGPPTKGNAGGVYEEAWDLRQRELEHTIQEAHRIRSCSSENNNTRPKGVHSNIPSAPEQIYTGNYEEPWDSKEKEKELEEKLSKASIHSPSGSDRPPEYNAPPPPPPQNYEEAWDIRPSSKLISKVAGNKDTTSSSSSPSSPSVFKSGPLQDSARPGSIKHSTECGERIDPGLPLDIQKFYHGSISRKVAEDLLLVHKEGSYLIRRSETNQNVFSLSLKGVGGMPMHIRISLQKGEYILGENSQPFPTVPEMVDYFTRHDLPVMKAERIKLLHPVQRNN